MNKRYFQHRDNDIDPEAIELLGSRFRKIAAQEQRVPLHKLRRSAIDAGYFEPPRKGRRQRHRLGGAQDGVPF